MKQEKTAVVAAPAAEKPAKKQSAFALAMALMHSKRTAEQVGAFIKSHRAAAMVKNGEAADLKAARAALATEGDIVIHDRSAACWKAAYTCRNYMTTSDYNALVGQLDKENGYTPAPKPEKKPKAKKATTADLQAMIAEQQKQIAALTALVTKSLSK